MITKEEHIKYWIDQANDDWEAVNALIKNGKNLQGLFFTHLVIEKLGKAVWIKDNEGNIPSRTHNLLYILSQTQLILTDEQSEFFLNLNRFQLEGRYPEYITKMQLICDEKFTNEIISKTDEQRKWLIENLQ
jgi:HEPN domain-containing protein